MGCHWLVTQLVIGWQISFSSSSSSTVCGVLFCNTGSSIRKPHSWKCHWWRVLYFLRCKFEFFYVLIVFVFLTLSQYLCSSAKHPISVILTPSLGTVLAQRAVQVGLTPLSQNWFSSLTHNFSRASHITPFLLKMNNSSDSCKDLANSKYISYICN